MKERYLEITYRKGKPIAAYLYLQRKPGAVSARTEKVAEGIVVDFDDGGNPIGFEIISPATVSIALINKVAESLEISPLTEQELSPLKAA